MFEALSSHMTNVGEDKTVIVTTNGEVTIPKRFREKLNIDTPGRVRFVETDRDEVVIRPVTRPSDIRGELDGGDEDTDQTATELLRKEREKDEK